MKTSFLEKLLERAPRVGSAELQTHLVRLAEEKGFLETLFNALQEGVTVLDDQGRLVYWNRAAERLLTLPETLEPGAWSLGRSLRGVDWKGLLQERKSSSGSLAYKQACQVIDDFGYPKRLLRWYLPNHFVRCRVSDTNHCFARGRIDNEVDSFT